MKLNISIAAACSSELLFAAAFTTPQAVLKKKATCHRHASDRSADLQQLCTHTSMRPLDELADDDLVAVPFDGYIASTASKAAAKTAGELQRFRLCVVRNNQQYISPLVRHENDVDSDLFLDPRYVDKEIFFSDFMKWWIEQQQKANAFEPSINDRGSEFLIQCYGVGWYGQRPVPSLGGGPGYGAEADEVWSIDEDLLELILSGSMEDGTVVEIPVIDVGMAHGEKARGGALF